MSLYGHQIAKIVGPYCDRIRHTKNHYVCYPKGYNKIIAFASSSSDRNQAWQVARDFKTYAGITIPELMKKKGRKVSKDNKELSP